MSPPPLLVPLSPFAIVRLEMLTVLAIATSKTRYFLSPSTVTVSTDVVGALYVNAASNWRQRASQQDVLCAYAWYVKINGSAASRM